MWQLLILLLTLLLLLFFRPFVAQSTNMLLPLCPLSCQCKHYPYSDNDKKSTNVDYYTAVKCPHDLNGTNLTLENSTRILQIENLNNNNNFNEFLQLLSESELPLLDTLIIKYSNFDDEYFNVDLSNIEIHHLSLTYNNLTSIPELLNNSSLILDNIKSLDLSHNAIRTLTNFSQTLETLEILNLSGNNLNQISNHFLHNFKQLKSLDLSCNNLTRLDADLFKPFVHLQFLNLSYNHLEQFNEHCFNNNLNMLQHLDLSWNNLIRIAPGSLQFLPNLSHLLLTGNGQLDRSVFLGGAGLRLQIVDVSATGLKQIPATLTHSIRTLNVADNLISTINCGEMDSYPLLQRLDLTGNQLVTVEDDALGRLESLAIIYFNRNYLETIPKILPESLIVLHFEINRIVMLSTNDFDGLRSLEVLLLNDNKIRSIANDVFHQLHSLATLDLSNNPIYKLGPGSLSGPLNLRILRLRDIDTTPHQTPPPPLPSNDVSTFPLSNPEHLITLDLSNSPVLGRQLFADTATLAAARELQELNLSGNRLEFIRSDLLYFLPELRVIHLKGNQLNCNGLEWLAKWMRWHDQHEYRDIICAKPIEYFGTRLIELIQQDNNNNNNSDTENRIETNEKLRIRKVLGKSSTIATTTTTTTRNNTNNNANFIKTSPKPSTLLNETVKRRSSTIFPIKHDELSFFKTKSISGTVTAGATSPPPPQTINLLHQQVTAASPNNDIKSNKMGTKQTSLEDAKIETSVVAKMMEKKNHEKSNVTISNITLTTAHAQTQQQWNASSTIAMSIYTNTSQNGNSNNSNTNNSNNSSTEANQSRRSPLLLYHPGMLILVIGLLCGAASMAMFAARLNNRKRHYRGNNTSLHYRHHHHQQHHHHHHQNGHPTLSYNDIDMTNSSSISITELW